MMGGLAVWELRLQVLGDGKRGDRVDGGGGSESADGEVNRVCSQKVAIGPEHFALVGGVERHALAVSTFL
jgi:hypothetical protein